MQSQEDDCCSPPTLEFDDNRLMARSGIGLAARPTMATLPAVFFALSPALASKRRLIYSDSSTTTTS